MVKDSMWNKYEKFILNSGLTQHRRTKLYMVYCIVTRVLNLETAKKEDIENFIDDLNKNKFKKLDGDSYSGSTKQDIKKFLKQFFKWYKGDNQSYPIEVSWLNTRMPKDEKPQQKPVIEIKDVVKLAQAFEKYEYRMITLLLFDSGFRISEMLSAKKQDLTWAEYDGEGNKCFWIKCNESKTFLRNIPVPLFTVDLKAFTDSSYYKSKNDNEPLFDFNYPAYLKQLKLYSKRILNVRISCHSLRHSSATYYSKKLAGNVPMLAQRFGWSYSAPELQTYVRTSGAYNKESAKLVFKNDIIKLKEENVKLREDFEAFVKKVTPFIIEKARAEYRQKRITS